MGEWQRSGPEPGKDYSDIWYDVYLSEEAQEGRDAYRQRRTPDFDMFPKRP
jgi:1,4-dihydroxy-2-naphthoyl-CoA synthase